MRALWDTIYYNRGLGASNGNNYWKKYAVPHGIWIGAMLVLMGVGIGLVSLFVCSAYLDNIGWEMFLSYFKEPLILALNLVPCVLLVLFFYFLTGRAWAAFGLASIAVFVPTLINYYKIRIRSEALLVSDIALANEAAGILNRYTIEPTGRAVSVVVATVFGLVFAATLMRGKLRNLWARIIGTVLCLGLGFGLFSTVYQSETVYNAAVNVSAEYNIWSELAAYVSRGFVYPFIYSSSYAFPRAPEGYSDAAALEVLSAYTDKDIPEEKKINIISIMLEAYTDLSEHPEIGIHEDVYAPLYELYAESLHGHLSPNIYGGGTVNTERCFLTGYFTSEDYRTLTNSHVWYLRSQGYYAEGYHAGDSWFYNRKNIEMNLGMENYYFLEDFEGSERYDWSFFPILTALYEGRDKSVPYFNFSLTYQNHGSYASDTTYDESYLEKGALSEEAYNILNNYLHGIKDTTKRMLDFVHSLKDDPEPVVVIFFGDHMPWLGDGNFIFSELGITLEMSEEEGFCNYYNTPWIIWANDAAKAVTGGTFEGDGGWISPAYLMNMVLRECGVEGSAWMQYNDDLLDRVDIANTGSGIYRVDGTLYTSYMLEGEAKTLVEDHDIAEYYLKHNFSYSYLGG